MFNQSFKRLLTLTALTAVFIVSLSIKTRSAELLTNGSFEENLVGWTRTDTNTVTSVQYSWVVPAGMSLFDSPSSFQHGNYFHSSFPQDGSRSCMIAIAPLGVPDVTATIYQDITVPAGTSLTVSWKQRYSQNNSAAITQSNPRLRLVIKNPTTGAILLTPYQQLLADRVDEVTPWTTKSYNLGTAFAGQTVRLEFMAESYDENAPNYQTNRGQWEIDAVSANALAPTAASVVLSGRVRTADGRPLGRTQVRLMDINGNTQTALSNVFGYYSFNVEAGQVYALDVRAKGYNFIDNPRIINVGEEVLDVDFFAETAGK